MPTFPLLSFLLKPSNEALLMRRHQRQGRVNASEAEDFESTWYRWVPVIRTPPPLNMFWKCIARAVVAPYAQPQVSFHEPCHSFSASFLEEALWLRHL